MRYTWPRGAAHRDRVAGQPRFGDRGTLAFGGGIAAGDGRLDDNGKRIPMDVKKGDEVLYSKYGGTEIKVDGEELLVLRESDVLAKIQ